MSFQALSEALLAWPHFGTSLECEFPHSVHERLRQVLLEMSSGRPAAVNDLATLIHHAVRHELLSTRTSTSMRVPLAPGWPALETWPRFGMKILHADRSSVHLESVDYRPGWLDGADKEAPFDEAFSETVRRKEQRLLIDPCLNSRFKHFSHYTSPGQRTAIRSIFLARPGATLLVALPTGTGKSLVAWAPALMNSNGHGFALVIVPTVALALDQAEQAARLFGLDAGLLAWHGELDLALKRTIRERVRSGEQRLLFTSPESALGGLTRPLRGAARDGLLTHFVIDEAHLVAQWGTDFRPEFQALGGLRSGLLNECPPGRAFKTLLLTATLTEQGRDTLQALFPCAADGGDGRIDVISAVHLRPEPSYWPQRAPDESVRQQWVLEAIDRAPRPLILYGTTRDAVERWAQLLRARGYARLEHMHGRTSAADREETIRKWRARELDIIVATSAFGLGIDQSDVRTVIHACHPETVDRYYQEVGRGGRDGKACVSLLLPTLEDRKIAAGLNEQRIIGIQRGLERWEAMRLRATFEGDRCSVRLDAKPEGVDQDSAENEAWNVRTLVLMARAGLIDLDASPPPEEGEFDGDTTDTAGLNARLDEAWQRYRLTRTVRIVDPLHVYKSTWDIRVAKLRKASREADEAQFDAMDALIVGREEFAAVLSRIYTVPGAVPLVNRVCGGCPQCRLAGAELRATSRNYLVPEALPLRSPGNALKASLKAALRLRSDPTGLNYYITYPRAAAVQNRGEWRRKLKNLLKHLLSGGVREVSALGLPGFPSDYTPDLCRAATDGFFMVTPAYPEEPVSFDVARVVVLGVDEFPEQAVFPGHLLRSNRPLAILLFPDDLTESTRRDRRFCDVVPCISFHGILESYK